MGNVNMIRPSYDFLAEKLKGAGVAGKAGTCNHAGRRSYIDRSFSMSTKTMLCCSFCNSEVQPIPAFNRVQCTRCDTEFPYPYEERQEWSAEDRAYVTKYNIEFFENWEDWQEK
jgi:hypothetical protein